METVLLVIVIFVAIALVATILLQRSEGGALGIGGSSAGGLMSARGAADVLSQTTKWLAVAFLTLTLALSWLAQKRGEDQTAADLVEEEALETESPDKLPEIPTIPDSD